MAVLSVNVPEFGALVRVGVFGLPGDKGDMGVKGDQGDIGPPGADGAGTAWHVLTVNPDDTLGVDGDLVLNKTSGDIFRKASGTYTLQGNLQGPQGAAGAAGSTLLNGSGVPSSGLGTNGDFYYDRQNIAIYGPKTAGAWGAATSLAVADLAKWNSRANLAARVAIALRNTKAAKFLIIADSQAEEAFAFQTFVRDMMSRYPSLSPVPAATVDGVINGGLWQLAGVPFGWTHNGTAVTRGPSAYGVQLAVGQQASSANAFFAFTQQPFTKVRIHYIQGAGKIDVAIDGVTVATAVDTSSGHFWDSAVLTIGLHSVTVTGNTGTPIVTAGIFYVGNEASGVQVLVAGHSGFTTADYLALSGGTATGPVPVSRTDLQDFIAAEAPDCIVFETCINDGSVANYTTKMDALLTATRATAPNATFVLLTPEPVAAHAWMTGIPPAARALAIAHGALHADAASIIYDHSAQSGGVPDVPYGVSFDGVHYATGGAHVVSELLHATLALPPRTTEFAAFSAPDGGVVAPFYRSAGGGILGIGAFGDSAVPYPGVTLGYMRTGPVNGLLAGDDGSAAHLPSTFFAFGGEGKWNLFGSRIVGATSDPAVGSELVPRSYIDKIAQPSVRLLTNEIALTSCTYANGSSGVGATLTGTANGALAVDSITPSVGDRIAVNDQASTLQNGLYVVTAVGDSTHPFILTRSTSFDTADEMYLGTRISVTDGTYAGSQIVVTAVPAAVGTNPIGFTATIWGSSLVSAANVLGAGTIAFNGDVVLTRNTANHLTVGASAGVTFSADVTAAVGHFTGLAGTAVDTDSTMVANSDTKVASQKATLAALRALGYGPQVRCATNQIALPTCTYAQPGGAGVGIGATLTATGNGAVAVDSIAVANGDRVIVNDQAATEQNGVYVVTQAGDSTHPFILTRAVDFDEVGEIRLGGRFMVQAGTYGNSDITVSTVATVMGDASTGHIGFTYNCMGSGLISAFNVLGAAILQFTNGGTIASTATNKLTLGCSAGLTITGDVTLSDAKSLVVGTTTGTKIGTATTQKLGFWAATPIVQPTGATDILTGLINAGLRASGANQPLNMGTGALTSGALTVQGDLTLSTHNLVTDTTTGTQLATGSTQKLALWGAAPAAQPAGSTDILAALITLGARASGANPPLNMGTGALTSGVHAITGNLTASANIGFNGKTAQALTGIAAPTATALRTAAPNATYSTTLGTGTTAGAFDTAAHRDNVITDLAATMQRLGALITDLRANGVVG